LYYKDYYYRKISKRKRKQRLIRIIILLLLILCLSFIGIFIFKNRIFKYYFSQSINKIENKYPIKIKFRNCKFIGLNTIFLENLNIRSYGKYNLLDIKKIKLEFDFFSILLLNPQIKLFETENLSFYIIKTHKDNNFDFFFKPKTEEQPKQYLQNTDYAYFVNQVVKTFFYNTPEYVSLVNSNINLKQDSLFLNVYSSFFSIKNHNIYSKINISSKNNSTELLIKGKIINDDNNLCFSIYSDDKKEVSKKYFPYLQEKYNLKFSFDTLNINFHKNSYDKDVLNISAFMKFNNLIFFHKRIALEDVFIKELNVNINTNINANSIEIDSTSEIKINKLTFNPYVSYQIYPKQSIVFTINKPFFNAMDLFTSFPKELFQNLRGIETSGELNYRLFFKYEQAKLDSLEFSSTVKTKKFKILKLGESNINKINGSFVHHVYENDKLVRELDVSDNNPKYVKLENISKYLLDAVLTSEDGQFFWHRGFNEEAFRLSIIKNIKEKRFARGGSTISMQLVKNVFLNRNKTIVRKLEEALIVWLIENNNITNKKRMLEVYFNIIEWGPNIYGVSEAADYYFNKTPQNIDLKEGIFLACIVPNPKNFKYYFDKNGFLRPFMVDYYKFISKKMFSKEYITKEEYEELLPVVNIRGKAKELLNINTSDVILDHKTDIEKINLYNNF